MWKQLVYYVHMAKNCELCETEVSVYSRFCKYHAAERRKQQDRNRKRQERVNGRDTGVKTSQDRQREIKRRWVCEYLIEHPCVDCGEPDILVLEFDHRGDITKHANVSTMINSTYSLARVQEEVAKCDVRCANCHKRKTYERFGDTYRTKFLAEHMG